MRWFDPFDLESKGDPGIAKTTRFFKAACRAVISEPDFSVASTTRMPGLMSGTSLFWRGKYRAKRHLRQSGTLFD